MEKLVSKRRKANIICLELCGFVYYSIDDSILTQVKRKNILLSCAFHLSHDRFQLEKYMCLNGQVFPPSKALAWCLLLFRIFEPITLGMLVSIYDLILPKTMRL
jgi:hypothetical protein